MAAEGQNVMQLSVYSAPVAAELMLQAIQRGELAGDARLLALIVDSIRSPQGYGSCAEPRSIRRSTLLFHHVIYSGLYSQR